MNLNNITPCGDRILIKRDPVSDKTDSGIILPESVVHNEKLLLGTVVSCGKGKRTASGVYQDMGFNNGDRVLFAKYGGIDLGEELVMLREEEIIGIMEKKSE